MNLEPECGVTKVSLKNAFTLLVHNGRPDRIELALVVEDPVGGALKYHTTVEWFVPAHKNRVGEMRWHTFTGFSWGFHGTGPSGLQSFLAAVDLSISRGEIAGLRQHTVGIVAEFNQRYLVWSRVSYDGKGGSRIWAG